ncbi:hypothetical protein SBA1_1470012 [Candidatus Sulfotelmatobacter kueseliae]|uniref:Uncharacterized protein n=1 Tax=Candidatus Sulfotelmatobacter kueseliae TaxID=2042962 RepID=A0A2U3K8F8_9BACT|nr:hypothetical protein SBA1_1470012 [Candidatus Sulfotelmatobacter kueseliae]
MADRFIFGVAPLRSRLRPTTHYRRFGYSAPHPGAKGTSTLLNNVLLSTHYYGPVLLRMPFGFHGKDALSNWRSPPRPSE